MKILLTLFLAWQVETSAMAHVSEATEVTLVRKELTKARMTRDLDNTLDHVVKLAVWELRKHGATRQADEVLTEWRRKFKGRMTKAIGDFKPLNQWLSDLSDLLMFILGEDLMRITHLEDIKILNYTIPVVFGMEDFLSPMPRPMNAPEYKLHFVPFLGIVSYWSIWTGCTVATWGAGAWFLICMPASEAGKVVTVEFIAPPLSPQAYQMFWE